MYASDQELQCVIPFLILIKSWIPTCDIAELMNYISCLTKQIPPEYALWTISNIDGKSPAELARYLSFCEKTSIPSEKPMRGNFFIFILKGSSVFNQYCSFPLQDIPSRPEKETVKFPSYKFASLIPSYLGNDDHGDYPIGYDAIIYYCARRLCMDSNALESKCRIAEKTLFYYERWMDEDMPYPPLDPNRDSPSIESSQE